MVRRLCLRVGVTPWTATILAGMIAVFGSGWENIVFAIQLVYNLSLLAFLVHLSLIDHEGPPNRRDALGVVAGLVAVSSSGFGPFFILGTLVFMVMRRAWKAAAIATIPPVAGLGVVVAVLGQGSSRRHGPSLVVAGACVRRTADSRPSSTASPPPHRSSASPCSPP